MTTVRDRKLEQERVRKASRERARRAKAGVRVELDMPLPEGITEEQFEHLGIERGKMTVMLSQAYAPIIRTTGDDRLINIAEKYKLPLSQEQRFLLETEDAFLEQFVKKEIPEEEQYALYAAGWNPLVSSNLKAVKVLEEDLIIMFHDDSIYQYPDKANMYYPFSEALSPGRLLWRTIRTGHGHQQIA